MAWPTISRKKINILLANSPSHSQLHDLYMFLGKTKSFLALGSLTTSNTENDDNFGIY